jgi:hypothetical protein
MAMHDLVHENIPEPDQCKISALIDCLTITRKHIASKKEAITIQHLILIEMSKSNVESRLFKIVPGK